MRWPLLLAILLAVITAVYRYRPNVRHTWRQCLPGAALAVLLWVGAAALFRAYLLAGAGAPTGFSLHRPARRARRPSVGASIGTVVWMYLSALAVLTGA